MQEGLASEKQSPERQSLPSNSSVPDVGEMYRVASAHKEGHGAAALRPRWLQPASKDFMGIHCIPNNHRVTGWSCRAEGLCSFSSPSSKTTAMPQLLKGGGPCWGGVPACTHPRRVSADGKARQV